MTDPAVEASRRAKVVKHPAFGPTDGQVDAAREALKPVRAVLSQAHQRYAELHELMISAENAAEQSRHASELVGLRWLYDKLVPLAYSDNEIREGVTRT